MIFIPLTLLWMHERTAKAILWQLETLTEPKYRQGGSSALAGVNKQLSTIHAMIFVIILNDSVLFGLHVPLSL